MIFFTFWVLQYCRFPHKVAKYSIHSPPAEPRMKTFIFPSLLRCRRAQLATLKILPKRCGKTEEERKCVLRKKNIPRRGCYKKIVSRKKEREWGNIILGKMRSKLAGEQKRDFIHFSGAKFRWVSDGKLFWGVCKKKAKSLQHAISRIFIFVHFSFRLHLYGKETEVAQIAFSSLLRVPRRRHLRAQNIFLCKIGSRKYTDLTNISNKLHKALQLI